jgi:hypothetical protein
VIVDLLQYSGFSIASIGLYLLSSGRVLPGNYVSLVGDLLLIVYGYLTKQYGLLLANVFYSAILIIGIVKERRKDVRTNS